MESGIHVWTPREKLFYALSLIPFLVAFAGALRLLWIRSPYLALTMLALYLIINILQAGCCVGCPYRGKYCPALGGVYLGNLLSGILYAKREFEQGFFDRNAKIAETLVLVTLLFPVYWIARAGWYLVPIYIALIAAHVALFMPTQCGKCSYNTTCPGGIAWLKCRGRIGRGRAADEV